MTLPDFRLIRLLPLASLVLTACTLPGHKGPARARIPLSGASISKRCVI
ncbi:outer membrane lipoprotein [Salmonella enterica subsp. enterica]|uniref:Outer membrane lipoprotein n=1 Tax=Salmonella enterica I TaxID=59201 RepID=A0A379WSM7_SALET|nr:outer membrane lipoprotein [Salmonella enterica subsp. enterica]